MLSATWSRGQVGQIGKNHQNGPSLSPNTQKPQNYAANEVLALFFSAGKKRFFSKINFSHYFLVFSTGKEDDFHQNPLSICIGFPIETVRPKSLSDRFFENTMSKVRRISSAPGQTDVKNTFKRTV